MIAIYKITSPSGKVYIGQTINTVKRFSKYKTGDTSRQPKLHSSFIKYGFSTHKIEVLFKLNAPVDRELLDRYEIFYIALYKNSGAILMNLDPGGRGCRHSDETLKKMSDATKGIPLEIRIGKEAADRQKARMSRDKKGVPHTKQHAENISKGLIGKSLSSEHIEKLRSWKRSDEMLNMLRTIGIGRKLSQEEKVKRSEAAKARYAIKPYVYSEDGLRRLREAQKKNVQERKAAKLLACQQ